MKNRHDVTHFMALTHSLRNTNNLDKCLTSDFFFFFFDDGQSRFSKTATVASRHFDITTGLGCNGIQVFRIHLQNTKMKYLYIFKLLLWSILLNTAHKYGNVKRKASWLATSGTLALAILAQIPADVRQHNK